MNPDSPEFGNPKASAGITDLAWNPGNSKPEILVELEFHADFSIGSGT